MIRNSVFRVAEPPREADYWCRNGHHTPRMWSAAVAVPEQWECRHCGLPAGHDRTHPPHPRHAEPFKTPLAYLLERRSEAECEALLDETLRGLGARRRGHERTGGRP